MMEPLLACRICLATDVKLYELCQYRLKTAYEHLTGIAMSSEDSLQYVCSYCGTLLKKFTQFRDRSECSQRILQDLLIQHATVTTHHINCINRDLYNLSVPYTQYSIQNYDCTVTVKEESYLNFDNNSDNDNYSEHYSYSDYKSDDDLKNSILENSFVNRTVDRIQYDSDEEPLSRKARKGKRQKSKKELKPLSTQTKFNSIYVKSEGNGDQNYLTIDDQNLATNDDQNVTNNDQNATNGDQNLTEYEKKFRKNSSNTRKKQVLDPEIDHKLVILTKDEQIEEVLFRKTSANYINSVYKCDSCYKGFMTSATYKNHMARHDPSCGPVACPVCATRWPHERALRAHTLIAHERRYTCRTCGATCKSRHKAAQHRAWHAGATFPCAQCGRAFSRATTYLTHARLAHASHPCDQCGHSFIGELGLSMHRKKAHCHERVVTPSLHECDRCHVGFRSTEALTRHCDVTSGQCDNNLQACTQCGDHFDSDQLLKEHTDMHRKNDALRTCTQCSRTFASERSLGAHVQRAHASRSRAPPRHLVCEVCGYTCISSTSLVNHQRVHSGEKPHACSMCNKRFSVAQRLQIHIRTHTGERPFQCTRCPKAFKHKAALNRHDRVHTGVKPYACPHCGKRFSQSNSMKQHCAGVHMKTNIYSRTAQACI